MEPIRNTKGGKGFKQRKTRRERNIPKKDYQTDINNGDAYYAQVKKIIGGNKVEVISSKDGGQSQVVTIPGRMNKGRRGGYIRTGNNVLVNDDEILRIIRLNDADNEKAKKAMATVGFKSEVYNNDPSSDDDSEDDDDNKLQNMNKIGGNKRNDIHDTMYSFMETGGNIRAGNLRKSSVSFDETTITNSNSKSPCEEETEECNDSQKSESEDESYVMDNNKKKNGLSKRRDMKNDYNIDDI
jgi:hypothetical protein